MVGWHHRHNGHGFGWTLGVGDGQGGPVCCGSWGRKELDMTEATQHAHIQVWSKVGNEVGSPYNQPRFSMRTLVSALGLRI